MCRNIRTLFNFEPVATDTEIHAAAVQYVRKISGFTKPSRANQETFDRAVAAVADATRELVLERVTSTGPRNRDTEAARARERAAARFGSQAS